MRQLLPCHLPVLQPSHTKRPQRQCVRYLVRISNAHDALRTCPRAAPRYGPTSCLRHARRPKRSKALRRKGCSTSRLCQHLSPCPLSAITNCYLNSHTQDRRSVYQWNDQTHSATPIPQLQQCRSLSQDTSTFATVKSRKIGRIMVFLLQVGR